MRRHHRSGYGPDEAHHLTCDSSGDDHLRLSGRDKMAVALAHPQLSFPGDIARSFRQPLNPVMKFAADASLHPITPRALDQGAPRKPAARFGYPAPAHRVPAGMLRWRKTQISHQLPWIVETLEVPNLGHHGHCDDER